MKQKTFRLHYKYIAGYEPEDHTRNYLCMTFITPRQEGIRTLAVDEDVLDDIFRHCKDTQHEAVVADELYRRIKARLNEGKYEGSIQFAVDTGKKIAACDGRLRAYGIIEKVR